MKNVKLLFLLLTLLITSSFAIVHAQDFNINDEYQKTDDIEGVRVIASKNFKNLYLRIAPGGGAGTQTFVKGHETMVIEKTDDGYYSIRPNAKPYTYLRMDGAKINSNSKAPGGVVNTQNRVGGYEKFKIEKQSDGSYSIESVAFPGRFLNMNPNNVLRVQNRAGSHERFFLYAKKGDTGSGGKVSLKSGDVISLKSVSTGYFVRADSKGNIVNVQTMKNPETYWTLFNLEYLPSGDGNQCYLQPSSGAMLDYYLSAAKNFNYVWAKSKELGNREVFTCERNGDKIRFKAFNGKYVVANKNAWGAGTLTYTGDKTTAGTEFTIEAPSREFGFGEIGSKVILKTSYGQYVKTNVFLSQGPVRFSSRSTPGEFEKLTVELQKDGSIALKAANGQYVSPVDFDPRPTGDIVETRFCTNTQYSTPANFTVEALGNGRIALKYYGLYLTVKKTKTDVILFTKTSMADKPGETQQFIVQKH